jgi:hypothetical protein
LISSATTTRINPNLQSESLLELSGFQDIWSEMLAVYLSDE